MVMLIYRKNVKKLAMNLLEVELRKKRSTFEARLGVKMAAGLSGYQLSYEELVYADAGYVNYGEPALRNREDS